MSPDAPDAPDRPSRSRARLRRSGRHLVRLGGLLAVVSLVVTLLGGWATRSLLDHLQSNSAELLDGVATVSLSEGDDRTLYVTGGLIAPGDIAPTPVEQITCTITGPGGELPFESLADQGRRVGLDTALARFQVVGSFQAAQSGEHDIECAGRGVVVAPEVGPANALLRLGGLVLGTLGSFVGLSMLLIGGVLLLVVRGGGDEEFDDAALDDAAPPAEGADEWWEDEARDGDDGADDAEGELTGSGSPDHDEGQPPADGDYIELTDEELASLTPEQIDELVRSGDLVWVEDEPHGQDQDEIDASGRPGG